MNRTNEAEYLDEATRECIEYARDFDISLRAALEDYASELSMTGYPLSERQINLIWERLRYVEM
jgi:hypothetical protein